MDITKLLINTAIPLMVGGNNDFNWKLFFWGIQMQLVLFLFFALIYYFLRDDFKFKNRIDPFYYSLVTQTGAGYGDYSPTTTWGKIAAMLHLGASYVFYTPLLMSYYNVPR